MGRDGDLPSGITRTATGYRVFQWVRWPGYPNGRVRSKCFTRRPDYEPTIRECQAWQDERRVESRRRLTTAAVEVPIGEGFLADAERYLDLVKSMPSFKGRRREVRAWATVFGERSRSTITSAEIRAQRDRFLTDGPKMVYVKGRGWTTQPIGLAPQSVNLLLRALENLYTVLDGKHAHNPVRDVPEVDPPDPHPRGQSFALGYEILAHMPDITTPKKGELAEAGSLSRVRFETMLMTGLEGKQLGALLPEAVNWQAPSIVPPRRMKGRPSKRHRAKRRRIVSRQLMPAAVPVLRRFFALGANQPFSNSSLRRAVHAAIRKANVVRAKRRLPLIPTTLRVKDLTRHTFGTEVFRATKSPLLVKELMGHVDLEQSLMYAAAAVQEHQVDGVAVLSKVADRARRRRTARAPDRRPYICKVSPPQRSVSVRTRPTRSR
jgi:hypothetical protein